MTTIVNIKRELNSKGKYMSFHLDLEDGSTINCYACGDCCSESLIFELDDYSLDKLIGKKYIDIHNCNKFEINQKAIDEMTSEIEDDETWNNCLEVIYYEILLEDEDNFRIVLANYSNGYYTGSFLVNSTRSEPVLTLPEMSLIFIIGLPACGKTTYVQTLDTENTKIYDDLEIKYLLNIQKIREDLESGYRVIIVSALLCDYETYEKVVKKLSVNKDCIITCLFNNDKNASIQNEIRRTNNVKKLNDIERLSKNYRLDNNYIHKYGLPTWLV